MLAKTETTNQAEIENPLTIMVIVFWVKPQHRMIGKNLFEKVKTEITFFRDMEKAESFAMMSYDVYGKAISQIEIATVNKTIMP